MHTRIKKIAEERVAGLKAVSEQKARESKAAEEAGEAAAAAAAGGADGEEARGGEAEGRGGGAMTMRASFSERRSSFSAAVDSVASVAMHPNGWVARLRNPRAVSFRSGLVAAVAPCAGTDGASASDPSLGRQSRTSAPPSSAAPGMQRRRSSFSLDTGGRGTFSAGGGEVQNVSAFAAMAKAAAEARRSSIQSSQGDGQAEQAQGRERDRSRSLERERASCGADGASSSTSVERISERCERDRRTERTEPSERSYGNGLSVGAADPPSDRPSRGASGVQPGPAAAHGCQHAPGDSSGP